MCGILGYYSLNPFPDLKHSFEKSLKKLFHRGPDDYGYEQIQVKNGEGWLGHTRLSIIDLSKSGKQPMVSVCGRYTLVFNGEIYNYKELRIELTLLGYNFISDSDTEVLLISWIKWREKCLARLTGMFAFAIFDRLEKTIHCVRDSFGIKPFFYYIDKERICFCSEIPPIVNIVDRNIGPNFQRGYEYLVAGRYDNSTDTFFDGIHQLLPGHLMRVSIDSAVTFNISEWWQPSIDEGCNLSFTDAAEKLRDMFLNNVRLHLRSDVPIGAALSGGVDSSAIVCAMRHVEPDLPIHTFSFVARGTSVDEEKWIDIVNHHVGAISHKVQVTPDDWITDLDDMIRVQGEPFGSTSIYAQYRLYKHAKQKGVTVTLDGQGADELLAGYNGYPVQRVRSLIDTNRYLDAIHFLRAWGQWPDRSISDTLKQLISPLVPPSLLRLTLKAVGRDPFPTWLDIDFIKGGGIQPFLYRSESFNGLPRGRHLSHILRESLKGKGLNALLRHGDRNSMRWSVESRVPFLTAGMAEFLLSLPENYLISDIGETKHIFRTAMRGIVPNKILDRKDKIGFQSPERDWLRAARPAISKILDDVENVPILNNVHCRSLVKKMLNGQIPFNGLAWRIINYVSWYRMAKSGY
jgi:asparagine synthase (glutamine-hydrolysing)